MNEQWKSIPGYEGIYEVSDIGRVRSCEGKTTQNRLRGTIHWKQRIIKQKYQARKGSSDKKDARVILWKDKKWKTFLVSRLVALAWCSGYADGMTVNHIDGDPLNNKAVNLEWVSHADNIRKGFEDGLFNTQKAVILTDAEGHQFNFRSMSQASQFLGRNCGYISCVVARGRDYADGYSISV